MTITITLNIDETPTLQQDLAGELEAILEELAEVACFVDDIDDLRARFASYEIVDTFGEACGNVEIA